MEGAEVRDLVMVDAADDVASAEAGFVSWAAFEGVADADATASRGFGQDADYGGIGVVQSTAAKAPPGFSFLEFFPVLVKAFDAGVVV